MIASVRCNISLFQRKALPMLTLTQEEMPKFILADPEATKTLTKKMMTVWIGAMSPMWAPYMLASGFGITVWMASKALGATPHTLPKTHESDESLKAINTPEATIILDPIPEALNIDTQTTEEIMPQSQPIEVITQSEPALEVVTDMSSEAPLVTRSTRKPSLSRI
jgi:hypothetical protein